MSRAYGNDPICPDDGGLLLSHPTWGESLYCPNNRHGGNGRFFKPSEADHGVPTHNRAPKPASTADLAAAAAMAAEREKVAKAKEAKAARDEQAAKKESRPRRSRGVPKECKCGCGEMTKGGTFRPGHDARYYAQNGGH